MSPTPTPVGQPSAAPGQAILANAQDQLIAGPYPEVTQSVTLAGGHGVIARGTVLGRVTKGAPSAASAAKSGGNTGNGTCTSVTARSAAVAGVYQVRVAIAGTNAATFDLYNPSGDLIDQRQYNGSGATAIFFNDALAMTLTDGSTDFVVGDGFDVTVTAAAASGSYVPSVATATDGSQVPVAIAADIYDATAGDVVNAAVYSTGEFNFNYLTYDASWASFATLQAALQPAGIYLRTYAASLSIANPT